MAITKLYNQILSQSHSAIETGYSSAIAHYNQMKNQFLNQLEIHSGKTVNDFMEKLNEQVGNEIESSLEQDFNTAFSAIADYFETNIVNKIKYGNRSVAVQELKNKFKQQFEKYGENPQQLYQRMKTYLEQYLLSANVTREGLAQITQLKHQNNIDIQNQLFGYMRKLLLAQLQGGNIAVNTAHYKQAMKGYYKEEVLTSALNKMLDQYDMGAASTGSKTNEKGLQIKYDIILGTKTVLGQKDAGINQIIAALNGFTNVSANSQKTIYSGPMAGIQSKSWIAPFDTLKGSTNRNWFSFGNAGGLIPQGTEAYYWHAGVRNVMNNLINIIGQGNFIYSTGNKIYWTADLLTEFKNNQYVLAFYKRKTEKNGVGAKIVDSGVGAMLHEDA